VKGTSAPMRFEMGKPLARLARCWKVTQRVDVGGAVMTWTDHDTPLTDPIDGLVYLPIAGGSQSDIVSDVSMQAANDNMSIASESPFPTLDSVRAGDWDYARREVFMLCWADTSKGRHVLGSGTIGQISVGLSDAQVEGRGLLNALSQSVGDLTQPGCRHRFGDGSYLMGGCNNDGTTDPEVYSVIGTVSDVSADGVDVDIPEVVLGSPTTASGAYAWGRLKVIDPDNLNYGRSADIKVNIAGRVQLHLPFPYPLTIGTEVQVYEGCDGLRETCITRFNNIYNFDGEPFLPGTDKMVQVARS
jgi:uncharacterized phage protein (TIGR02218 family)